MLQQILRDMWVDPEILAELDETQKQTLFCKMREEQVRRWRVWDQKISKDNDIPKVQKTSSVKKQVQFMQGEDGEPWVWVMGEHPDDKSIDTIIEEEARKKAIEIARREAHELRKSVEKELTHLIDYKPMDSLEEKFDLSPKSVDSLEDTLEIYCTVDDLRQRIQDLEPEVKLPEEKTEDNNDYRNDKHLDMDLKKNSLHFNFIEAKRDVLQELDLGSVGDLVSHRVAAWERRVAASRAADILRVLRRRRMGGAPPRDGAWREQERKAKEAEATMRSIARAAREEHRRTADVTAGVEPGLTEAGKPPTIEAIVEWFKTHELKKGVGLDENKKPVNWFHGLISRTESELLLLKQPHNSFLVRLSARMFGYALSVRLGDKCRHLLVDTVGERYGLRGADDVVYETLDDLIKYHKTVPITESGAEILLTTPCPPSRTPAILTTPS